MKKALIRIVIIGLVAYGGWYLWSLDSSDDVSTNDIKIEANAADSNTNEENLTFQIKKGDKKEIPAKIKKNILKSITENNNTNNSIIKVAEIANDSVVVNINNQNNTIIKVYFYDYNIDLSTKEIPAGNVAFQVVNNGRLSHNLTVGSNNFGRVAPGESKYFQTILQTGTFDIFSQIRTDQDHNMLKVLTVK